MDKSQKIKQTLQETRVRRTNMDIRVFCLKIDESKLSDVKRNKLEGVFREAKWIYNDVIGSEDAFTKPWKVDQVLVNTFNPETQVCDISEVRPLTLGSQIKQAVFDSVKTNISNLSKAKKKGVKVGKLKFKKDINRIHLKQNGTTFRIKDSYVSIQKIGSFRVRGLHQIKSLPQGCEIACADLIKKASGFYIHVTCYIPKETVERSGSIGIDLGIKDTVILSDGRKTKIILDYPVDLRRKRRKLSKKVKASNNYIKQLHRIRKSEERFSNRKDDLANKFVASLKSYETVAFQDDNISSWANKFGKTISCSILGRIKGRLKCLPTSVMIDRYFPSTQFCPDCGCKNKLSLNDREYECSCGYKGDRDIKAAKCILDEALKIKNTLAERKSLLVEDSASFGKINLSSKSKPAKQEAPML